MALKHKFIFIFYCYNKVNIETIRYNFLLKRKKKYIRHKIKDGEAGEEREREGVRERGGVGGARDRKRERDGQREREMGRERER